MPTLEAGVHTPTNAEGVRLIISNMQKRAEKAINRIYEERAKAELLVYYLRILRRD